MNLKPFVNDKALWTAFDEELSAYINQAHYDMEQTDDSVRFYRLQGQIQAFRKLKKLREKVNG